LTHTSESVIILHQCLADISIPQETKFIQNRTINSRYLKEYYHRINIREELSRRGSDWQYIFEMEHLPLHPTKPSLIEGRYPTVGHFEGK